jgi:hypothetical protein
MAAKPKSPAKRGVSRNGRAPIDWRSRINKPTETDPKKRAESVRRAATRIKTTARIDTIHPGQEY